MADILTRGSTVLAQRPIAIWRNWKMAFAFKVDDPRRRGKGMRLAEDRQKGELADKIMRDVRPPIFLATEMGEDLG